MGTLTFAWLTATLFAATVAYGQTPPEPHKDRLNTPSCQSEQRELESSLAQPDGASQDDQIKLKLQVERNKGLVASRCFDRLPDNNADDAARRAASRGTAPVAPAPVGG